MTSVSRARFGSHNQGPSPRWNCKSLVYLGILLPSLSKILSLRPFYFYGSFSGHVEYSLLNEPCKCVGCSIFWALLPEASLRDVLCPPTPSELLSREGFKKNLERIIDVISPHQKPSMKCLKHPRSRNPVESPNDKSKGRFAIDFHTRNDAHFRVCWDSCFLVSSLVINYVTLPVFVCFPPWAYQNLVFRAI